MTTLANRYQVFPSHAFVCPLCQILENNLQNAKWHAKQHAKWHNKEETKKIENLAKH